MSSEEKNSISLGFVAGYLVDNPPIGLISFWTIYGGGQRGYTGLATFYLFWSFSAFTTWSVFHCSVIHATINKEGLQHQMASIMDMGNGNVHGTSTQECT
jgi:hypothetical protein